MKPLRKKRLRTPMLRAPRTQKYDPKTGIVTLDPVPEQLTFGEAVSDTLGHIGRVGVREWARHNIGHFMTLAARTLPLEIAGKDGGPIQVTVVDPLAHLAKASEKEINPRQPKTPKGKQ